MLGNLQLNYGALSIEILTSPLHREVKEFPGVFAISVYSAEPVVRFYFILYRFRRVPAIPAAQVNI